MAGILTFAVQAGFLALLGWMLLVGVISWSNQALWIIMIVFGIWALTKVK